MNYEISFLYDLYHFVLVKFSVYIEITLVTVALSASKFMAFFGLIFKIDWIAIVQSFCMSIDLETSYIYPSRISKTYIKLP